MVDTLLPHDTGSDNVQLHEFATQAKEERKLSCLRTRQQNRWAIDASSATGLPFLYWGSVWKRTPVLSRGLCGKLVTRYYGPCGMFGKVTDVRYEFVDDKVV